MKMHDLFLGHTRYAVGYDTNLSASPRFDDCPGRGRRKKVELPFFRCLHQAVKYGSDRHSLSMLRHSQVWIFDDVFPDELLQHLYQGLGRRFDVQDAGSEVRWQLPTKYRINAVEKANNLARCPDESSKRSSGSNGNSSKMLSSASVYLFRSAFQRDLRRNIPLINRSRSALPLLAAIDWNFTGAIEVQQIVDCERDIIRPVHDLCHGTTPSGLLAHPNPLKDFLLPMIEAPLVRMVPVA
jgi:hypothetical protein